MSPLNPDLLLRIYQLFDPIFRLYPGHDSKLRFHRFSFPGTSATVEFIGYRLREDEPEEGTDYHNILYYSVMGLMYYCYGCAKVSDFGSCVDVACAGWFFGANLEELRLHYRLAHGPGVEIPAILDFPPPEPEETHTVTGYDS